MGRLDTGHPVAEGLVDRVAKRLATARNRTNFRAEKLHAVDIRRLATDILLAHVDDTVEAEVSTGGRRCHAVLTRTRLGNLPLLSHPQSEQRLAERVVDLVRAGVIQILALQPDLCPSALLGESPGKVERRRPADIVLEQ